MLAGVGQSWWLYILLGLAGGLFSGTFGVGAGIIVVPVLALVFGQKSAQGMALAVMVPMALVGAIRYKMNPQIELPLGPVALLACGAVVGAVIGATLAGWMSGTASVDVTSENARTPAGRR
jgi:uncharacterized membrane protein YfcA